MHYDRIEDLPRKYDVIYADPAWSYVTFSDKGKGRSPDRHYDCMSIDDIKALPVGDYAAKESALFLWVIQSHLPLGLEVMNAWGFNYSSIGFVWTKLNRKSGRPPFAVETLEDLDRKFFFGMGHTTRANAEICLLGYKKVLKRKSKAVRQLIISPIREHSRKPDEAYGRIDALFDGPKLELFARNTAEGWDCWGNEVGKHAHVPKTQY